MKKRRKKTYKPKQFINLAIIGVLLVLLLSVMLLKPKPKPIRREEIQEAIGISYTVDTIPQSNKRPIINRRIKYIVIHNTANPRSTARNERDYLTNVSNTSNISWHIVVDDQEIIEAIPPYEIAHHAGTDEGNEYGIGIEICESGDYQKAEKNAIKLTAYLMKHYKVPLSRVTTHQHFSGKPCPRLMIGRWDEFLDQVEVYYQTVNY